MQQDLNDLAVFAAVVECGTFTAAAERLAVGKSQVSHRIGRLEARLGMRLVQRTTRQQQITDFGQAYYQHCRTMLDAAERAQHLAEQATDTASGHLRAVCPPLFSELVLAPIVVEFMRAYPDVQLSIDQKYRDVDLVREGYDLAIRIRDNIADSSLIARSAGHDEHLLVAAPRLVDRRCPVHPEDLASLPSLSMSGVSGHGRFAWQLSGAHGAVRSVLHSPRLVCDDLMMLRAAAVDGHGVVAMPGFLCSEQIARGQLQVLLPDWSLPMVDVHVVYPSRQGLPPAVRAFIEFAAPRIGKRLDDLHARAHRDTSRGMYRVAGHGVPESGPAN